MKTLDEVINALEICGHDESPKCPYFDTEHWCCCEDHMRSIYPLKNDALHYLRNYRENQHAYEEGNRKAEEARERYLEAVKNCELAENKYKRLCKGTSQNFADTSQKITCPQCHSEFVILPEANNALTWQELTQMKGKPVWIVDSIIDENEGTITREGHWDIVRKIYPEQIAFYVQGMTNHKSWQGVGWQAFRKERNVD